MELLDRYLQAIRKYLPNRRQDDIIAELRANMESQIEDRESELGRALTQGEFEDLLRKMGPPVVVASRYQPQQYLIGPTFFPLYLYVLRTVLLWAFIVYCIVISVVVPLTSPNETGIVESLMRTPWVLINVAAWVTIAFAVVEFVSTHYPNVCPQIADLTNKWHPQSLPPLEKQSGTRKPKSYVQAIAEVVFGFIGLAWLLLIPRHPFLLMGPGFVYLRASPFLLAPVWWTFYWLALGVNVFQLAWKCIDLLRETWQNPARFQTIIFKVLGLTPLLLLLAAPDHVYLLLKNPDADQLRYGHQIDQINNGIHLGVAVICAIVVIQLAWDLWVMARDGYRSRGLPA